MTIDKQRLIVRDKIESHNNEDMFDIKELGYLLQLVDSGDHSGLMLELALSVKYKLQDRIQSIMKNKEGI
tara:strand:- start:38 stop:247 length:210 start_codon:yes stop_codon:yes gene_type:complete